MSHGRYRHALHAHDHRYAGCPEPHPHGPAHAQPGQVRRHALGGRADLLRTACECRAHPDGSHAGQPDGQGVSRHPRNTPSRSRRRLAQDRRRGARPGRAHLDAALARRAHQPCLAVAGGGDAAGAVGDHGRSEDLHRQRVRGLLGAARRDDRRDRRAAGSLPAGGAERQGGRFRRRRDPRRERLPHRPVPAGWNQHAR